VETIPSLSISSLCLSVRVRDNENARPKPKRILSLHYNYPDRKNKNYKNMMITNSTKTSYVTMFNRSFSIIPITNTLYMIFKNAKAGNNKYYNINSQHNNHGDGILKIIKLVVQHCVTKCQK